MPLEEHLIGFEASPFAQSDCKFPEVLLRTQAHHMRQLIPSVLELGEVGLGEALRVGMGKFELLCLGTRRLSRKGILILTTSTFVEPLRLALCTARSRRP